MSNTIRETACVCLARRPKGVPDASFFELTTRPVPELREGQFIVRNRFLSVDPAMRGWVNDAPNYLPPVAVGDVMRSFAVGEIVQSRNADFSVGETVCGLFGWQQYAISDGTDLFRRASNTRLSSSLALGVLGINGITAYFGLMDICAPRSGDTVVVSTASGAVGSCVGQIARSLGCRTVGIAGGPDKVRQCLDDFGYDAAIDYKSVPDLSAAVARACPDGVDIYFDNTCGPISDAVMEHLARGARIAVCGTAAIADWNPTPVGPRMHRQLLVNRARIAGFIVFDYKDRYDEAVGRLTELLDSGDLRWSEHVLEGLAAAPDAIAMLYRGENHGKLLIRLD